LIKENTGIAGMHRGSVKDLSKLVSYNKNLIKLFRLQ